MQLTSRAQQGPPTATAGGATSVHRLYLMATGGTGGDLANVNWFQFAC